LNSFILYLQLQCSSWREANNNWKLAVSESQITETQIHYFHTRTTYKHWLTKSWNSTQV